jgi:multiple sugar transport system substrate-binding protein
MNYGTKQAKRPHLRAAVVLLTSAAALTSMSVPAAVADASSAPINLTLEANATLAAKNNAEAVWENNYIIPNFEKMMKAKGVNVKVTFIGSGVSGEDYAAKLALEIRSGTGPDVFDLDGPYVGEFVEAGYLKPLALLAGPSVDQWPGWAQIPKSVQDTMEFRNVRYGIPGGPDGRVLFYNKLLFKKAGLPVDWQPHSWAQILSAAETLKAKDPGIEALQIDGGQPMGEATTLQGYLPILAGAGAEIWSKATNKWQGNTPQMRAAANFYHEIYSTGLASSALQLGPNGRNNTFQAFSENKVGIYLESEYLYISVVAPGTLYPMANEQQDVGWALIPAQAPGKGIRGQDYVSYSGGGGTVINPHTKYPKLAWDLLSYMYSEQSQIALERRGKPELDSREDVNNVYLSKYCTGVSAGACNLLKFISKNVLPITAVRPSLAVYPSVSSDIQYLAQNLATGMSVQKALGTYVHTLDGLVGAAHVANS